MKYNLVFNPIDGDLEILTDSSYYFQQFKDTLEVLASGPKSEMEDLKRAIQNAENARR